MTHVNLIKSISASLFCGWLAFQVVNAAEPSTAPASAATAPAAAAVVAAPSQTDSAAAPTVAAAQPTPKPGDEIICKKENVLGSRVRKVQVCRTKKEWQLEAQAAKDFTKGIDKGTAPQPGGQALPTGG